MIEIDNAVYILKNYKTRPLIYSVPKIEKHVSIYKNPYQPRCSFCKYLLVVCDNCVPKTDHYSLLHKFKTYCEKNKKNIKLITVWIQNLGWDLFNSKFYEDIDTEIAEWKSLNNDGTIIDFISSVMSNEKLYKEIIEVMNNYIAEKDDENDLECFLKWLYTEKDDYVRNTYKGYLKEWINALQADRELCEFYNSLKENYNDTKLINLLTNVRNFNKVIITYNKKESFKALMDDNSDNLLVIKF